jgi:hypothetical protein
LASPRSTSGIVNKTGRNGKGVDCTTFYLPNGQQVQKTPLNKTALKAYHVDHWQKFSSPVYETVVTVDNYHVVKDKGTAQFYI